MHGTHHPTSDRPRRRLVVLVPLLTLALLTLALSGLGAAPATAQEPAGPTDLVAVLDGEVEGLRARVAYQPFTDHGGMGAVVEVVNDGAGPVEVAIPFGLLLATDDQADQTMAVLGPVDEGRSGSLVEEVSTAAAAGESPTVTAAVGRSTHELVVFCTEADDGAPYETTEVHHLGIGEEPLVAVLRTAAVVGDGAIHPATQDAVWWVTDDVTTPVPSGLAPLLVDVDTASFAAAPHRVVPDTGYVPRWARGGVAAERFDSDLDGGDMVGSTSSGGVGGRGLGLLWILALAAIVVGVAIVAGRRRPPAPATVRASGWYPDPWAPGGLRWWDGRAWTAHVRSRT